MSLKDEMREAIAVALEKRGYPETAAAIRAEDWSDADRHGSVRSVVFAARAALSVGDEYEEVEVQKTPHRAVLRLRSSLCWESHLPSFIVYRKKEKPKPDVTELARRAVEAWRSPAVGFGPAMNALAEVVDE